MVADVAPNAEFELEHQNYMELEMDDAIGDTSDHDHNFTQSTTPQRVHRKTYFEVARFEDTQSWRQWMSEPEQQTWAKWEFNLSLICFIINKYFAQICKILLFVYETQD